MAVSVTDIVGSCTRLGLFPKKDLDRGGGREQRGFPGTELAWTRTMWPNHTRRLSAAGLRIHGMRPREGVSLSLALDVYVRGNSTWMGLCVHACIPVFVFESVYR